ncbi:hypersensitive response-inducing protein [Periconia macrospinosa]|uniref:Hypersensitive response-inducing protein n=1 Tax=Periconia macrospinosa TaxID=97972 RepID=A0A2V1ECF9_9PLEO|nr:hypersensitive response-inducing protein [Periconia macrospinosa]
MKFLTVAATSILAATASAAAILPRDNVFEVSNFYANCVQHSVMCNYQFSVLYPATGETIPVNCSATLSSIDGTLPPVTDGDCLLSSRTFDVARNDDGLLLTVKNPVSPSTNITGVYEIPAEQLVVEQSGASQAEKYVGPKEFGLAYAS